jgi:5-methyltetrahydropteroyltriglutamate--homocysteine methyltransferase
MKKHGVSRGFMNAALRRCALVSAKPALSVREAYLEALADALKAEYERLCRAGSMSSSIVLTLLCRADALLGLSMMSSSDREVNVDVMNHALRDIPRENVRE